MLAACYGPGKEPGDDPNRTDETPGEGRPAMDPAQLPVDKDRPTTLDRTPVADPGVKGNAGSEPKKP
jgi:hypothetical protein